MRQKNSAPFDATNCFNRIWILRPGQQPLQKRLGVLPTAALSQTGHTAGPITLLMTVLLYKRPARAKKRKKLLFPGLTRKNGCTSLLRKAATWPRRKWRNTSRHTQIRCKRKQHQRQALNFPIHQEICLPFRPRCRPGRSPRQILTPPSRGGTAIWTASAGYSSTWPTMPMTGGRRNG